MTTSIWHLQTHLRYRGSIHCRNDKLYWYLQTNDDELSVPLSILPVPVCVCNLHVERNWTRCWNYQSCRRNGKKNIDKFMSMSIDALCHWCAALAIRFYFRFVHPTQVVFTVFAPCSAAWIHIVSFNSKRALFSYLLVQTTSCVVYQLWYSFLVLFFALHLFFFYFFFHFNSLIIYYSTYVFEKLPISSSFSNKVKNYLCFYLNKWVLRSYLIVWKVILSQVSVATILCQEKKDFNFEKNVGKLQNKCNFVSHQTLLRRYFKSFTSFFFLQSYSHIHTCTIIFFYSCILLFSKIWSKHTTISRRQTGWDTILYLDGVKSVYKCVFVFEYNKIENGSAWNRVWFL